LLQIYNDSAAERFVETEFASIPDIVHVYKSFPQVIMKADMFRYLIAWRLGGVYADKDVRCAKPVEQWVSRGIYDHPSVDALVGVELDEAFSPDRLEKNARFHWARGFGISQYAFMTKPFSAVMRQAVIRSVSHATTLSRKYGIDRPDGSHRYSNKDIHGVTGPEMFTDTIMDVVQEASMEYPVTWRNFSGLTTPFHDASSRVCVLPVNYFGSGQRHSGSKPFDNPDACVNHYFLGTWKHG
jgi:alpha 1,6-mannosyltransferase